MGERCAVCSSPQGLETGIGLVLRRFSSIAVTVKDAAVTLPLSTSNSQDGTQPLPEAKKTGSMARKLVLSQLQQLQHGQITITDSVGTVTVGQEAADGLQAELTIHDPAVYRTLIWQGSLGFAECYLQGMWTTEDLTRLIRIFCRNMDQLNANEKGLSWCFQQVARLKHWLSDNSKTGSKRNIAAHYDLSNEFFQLFLDPTMSYSSALFTSEEQTLEEASVEKIDRACRQLELQPGDHLMEIGTGWGGLALHAVQNYGCRVTTTTLSRQQYELARQRIADAGLENQIEVLLTDYRDLQGEYDKLVSIEMIEAVGHRHLTTYFQQCNNLLKRGGKMLIQAITIPEQRYERYLKSADFIQRYIFPGGHLPSVAAMQQAVSQQTALRLIDLHEFGFSYARTLRQWLHNFTPQLESVKALGFDDRFINMWTYYLCYCEAAFLEQSVGVAQLTWNKARY